MTEEKLKQLKDEVTNFVDLHDWDDNTKTAAMYTGFHMINVVVNNLSVDDKEMR